MEAGESVSVAMTVPGPQLLTNSFFLIMSATTLGQLVYIESLFIRDKIAQLCDNDDNVLFNFNNTRCFLIASRQILGDLEKIFFNRLGTFQTVATMSQAFT